MSAPPGPIQLAIGGIDTVVCLCPRQVANSDLGTLRRLCGAPHRPANTLSVTQKRRDKPGPPYRLTVQQPSPGAIDLLQELANRTREEWVMNRVDVFVNFLTTDIHDAHELSEWMNRYLIQRRHGSKGLHTVGTTHYFSRKRWRCHNLVLYPDRPCKFTGAACCHLEWQAKGRDKVKALGLIDPIDLLELDVRAFWADRLVLEEVRSVVFLGKQLRGRAKAKKDDLREMVPGRSVNMDARAGACAMRATGDEFGTVSQRLRDRLSSHPHFRPKTSMRRLDTSPFLPTWEGWAWVRDPARPNDYVPEPYFPSHHPSTHPNRVRLHPTRMMDALPVSPPN